MNPQPDTLRWLAVALGKPVESLTELVHGPGDERGAEQPALRQPTALIHLPPTEPADHEYLDSVSAAIAELVALENRLGGDDVAPLSLRLLRTVQRRLNSGFYLPAIERDLQALAAETAELAGWQAHVADQNDLARQLDYEALHLARVAGDEPMELLILNNITFLDTIGNRPAAALQTTGYVLARPKISNRLAAMFAMQRARALALQRNREEALPLLAQAQSRFQDGVHDRDPHFCWWIDQAEILGHTGRCHSLLGDHALALDHLQRAIDDCPVEQAANRFHRLASLLGAALRAGAWTDAESAIARVLPLVGEVGARRTVSRLRRAIERIDAAAMAGTATPGLRNAGRQLAEVLDATSGGRGGG